MGSGEQLGCLHLVCSAGIYQLDKPFPSYVSRNKGAEGWVGVKLTDFPPLEENITSGY